MKVTVNSHNNFFESVTIDKDHVVCREIWIRIDEGDAEDWSTAVQVSLTCVIERDEFSHILEFQQIVGYDVELGPDQTDEGTRRSSDIHEEARLFCDANEFKLRNGRVEL